MSGPVPGATGSVGGMGSIRWNRIMWGNPDNWTDGGDGWDFHARSGGHLYDDWKHSVVKEFLAPYLGPERDVVEIGPGQGRWSEYIVENARTVTLVDLSANCIEECRRRFAPVGRSTVSFFVNDGVTLPVVDSSVDLIWSFGTFVHIEIPEIDRYLAEMRRVLRPGGRFVIHHAGRLEGHDRSADSGLRSQVSAAAFSTLTAANELVLDQQIRRWGPQCEYGLAFGDVVSLGRKAMAAELGPL
jgi:SAM-dependent methyltransferase